MTLFTVPDAARDARRAAGRARAAASGAVVLGTLAGCIGAGAGGFGQGATAAPATLVGEDGLAAGASAYNPSLTPDGRTLVFARSAPGFRRPVIHVSRLSHGRWSTPQPVPFTDPRWGDSDPTFTPDGRTLYFVSNRPADPRTAGDSTARDSTRRDLDVWRVRREPTREGERWGTPERLGPEVNTRSQELGPSWRDGVLYFASARRAGVGGLDLWAARDLGGGRFARAEPFGGALNTPASESDPELSPDGRTLLFWSDRAGGAGSADLYASRRGTDGRWSAPVPLRGAANSAWFDFTPALSADGRWLYFASERPLDAARAHDAPPGAGSPVQARAGEGAAHVWRVPAAAVLP